MLSLGKERKRVGGIEGGKERGGMGGIERGGMGGEGNGGGRHSAVGVGLPLGEHYRWR